ncbi:hypothetical protein, partial [Nostoc linckia]|uniref:hypothetical protein n=1 Tax=Nostoc linckia TaxID=92942 RepID=UPI001C55781B
CMGPSIAEIYGHTHLYSREWEFEYKNRPSVRMWEPDCIDYKEYKPPTKIPRNKRRIRMQNASRKANRK